MRKVPPFWGLPETCKPWYTSFSVFCSLPLAESYFSLSPIICYCSLTIPRFLGVWVYNSHFFRAEDGSPFGKLRVNFSTHHFAYSWSGRRVSNPQPPAWKAGALPIELLPLLQVNDLGRIRNSSTTKWGKMDSNHRSRRQQIYSLPHLATLVLPQNNEPKKGLEPPTAWLQIRSSTSWATSAFYGFYKELLPLKKGLQMY